MQTRNASQKGNMASRRRFIKAVGGAAVTPLVAVIATDSRAAELERLDETDPTAVRLKYVHDASRVPASLRSQQDSYCYNCALYAGSKDKEWAGCSIFPGKSVAGKGWCSVWARRQES